MSDRFVTIAAFESPIEAELVQDALKEEGIRTMLGGENVNTLFGGTPFAEITLDVHEEDREHADALLDSYEKEKHQAGPIELDDPVAAEWVCSLCGDVVDDQLTVCPSCQTARDSTRADLPHLPLPLPRRSGMRRMLPGMDEGVQKLGQTTGDRPLAAEEVDTDLEVPDVSTFLGDEAAGRALNASLLGLVLPLLIPYSLWLLVKLMMYPGELSPAGMRKMYLALLLNFVGLAFYFCVFFGMFIGTRYRY